jgi:hypothetical protein
MDFYKLGSVHALEKLALGNLSRTLLGAGAGAGLGAGIGGLTDTGAGTGAAIGAGVGGLGGRFSGQIAELAGRGRGKLTELLERRGAGAAEGAAAPAATEAAAPQAMGAQEFLFKAPMETIGPHQADIMARLPEFMQNPEAWQTFAKEKGLDILTRA